jgi:alkylation response protein AidB-like acyl-CoA dehydrogenase
MLHSDLPDDVQELAQLTRTVAEKKIAPLIDQVEREATFSREIQQILAEAGLFGLVVPGEYGGVDSDIRHQGVVLEELGRIYPSACTYLTAHWLATKLIALNANAPQLTSWASDLLGRAAEGAALGAIAATEPESGSDLGAITTRAVRDGDDWVINGTKRFITNGGFCDFYSVLARTGGTGSRGISVIVVEAERTGVTAARWEQKMGLHGSATAEMHFDDVRVPADHLVGEEGKGFTYLMRGFDEGRVGVAAMCLGVSQGAMDAAVRYAGDRRQFGRQIGAYQGVQFMLADMAIGVQTSRSLVYDAMHALVTDHPDRSRIAAAAKVFASDASMEITSNAVQVHGGSGYVRDFPVEMFMRDAKIGQIYEGTNQILRMLIARSYLGDVARAG